MFEKIRNRRLYNKAVSSIILPELNSNPISVCSKQDKRNLNIVQKFTLSFVMVIVMICAGTFVVSILNNYNPNAMADNVPKHSFTLVAYAVENTSASSFASSSDESGAPAGTVLQPNINIKVPHGKIFGENKVFSSVDNSTFVCSNKDIDSVTFTASDGNLFYSDPIKKQKIICTIDLSNNMAFFNEYIHDTNIYEVFKKLWREGSFDNYKEKYFTGMSTDLDNYYLISNVAYGDSKLLKNTIDIAYKTDMPKKGKSVTVRSGEKIHWSPSKEILNILAADSTLDFSKLKKDEITVTAKYNDGQTLTKTVIMSFDNDGYLYAKLLE